MKSNRIEIDIIGKCPASLRILILIGTLFAAPSLRAQASEGMTKSGSIMAGFSLPLGEFALSSVSDLRSTSAGFADYGFSVDGQFHMRFGLAGLGWAFAASAIFNSYDTKGFNSGLRNTFPMDTSQITDIEADLLWLNIPVMTGPRYEVPLFRKSFVYGQAMAGPSLRRAPDVSVHGIYYDGSTWVRQFKYGATPTLAMAIETGFVLNRFTVGTRFSFLGGSKVKAKIPVFSQGEWSEENQSRDFPVKICQIMIGAAF